VVKPTSFGGAHLIPVVDLPNEPAPDPVPIPNEEPVYGAQKVPEGWDTPGQTIGGLYYPPTRNPTLPDGSPWPQATHDAVKAALARRGDGDMPTLKIYVPRDGVGPTLLGENAGLEFTKPEGYDEVKFIGTPQATFSGGAETGHAKDSIEVGLRLATTNQFETIYFNRSFSKITNGMVESLIRPDVVAVTRPTINDRFVYHPYESLSPRQELGDRIPDIPNIPSIAPLQGERYKKSMRLSDEYCAYLGVRYICS
jgi:hypothetical protein